MKLVDTTVASITMRRELEYPAPESGDFQVRVAVTAFDTDISTR